MSFKCLTMLFCSVEYWVRLHGVWLILRLPQPWHLLSARRQLWHVWHALLIHQQEAHVRRLWQRVLFHVSSLGQNHLQQDEDLWTMFSPQQETPAQRRTDEAQSEGPSAFPHQKENQHQIMRRYATFQNIPLDFIGEISKLSDFPQWQFNSFPTEFRERIGS